MAHWKEIAGSGGTENKRTLIKYCNQWWPLYKLDDGAKWPLNGTLDYNAMLQLMLFLRREGKWDKVSYADMFFTLRNHPEWQRDCGMIPPQDPLALALERESKEKKNKPKQCCSSCDTGQRCTKQEKIHHDVDQELVDVFKPPPRGRVDTDSEGTITTPGSPVSSRTRQKQQEHILQAPLREAIGPEGTTMLIKVPFSTLDLEAWKKVAKDYCNNPINVTKDLQFIVKQHNPDWSDMPLLLEAMTETERQLILKTARDLAEDYYKMRQEDEKEFFPLQDPKWDQNRSAEMAKLQAYKEWLVKGVERAIPKTVNWAVLYAVKQGPRLDKDQCALYKKYEH